MCSNYITVAKELQQVFNKHVSSLSLTDWHMLALSLSASCVWNSSLALVNKKEPLDLICALNRNVKKKIVENLDKIDNDLSSQYYQMVSVPTMVH